MYLPRTEDNVWVIHSVAAIFYVSRYRFNTNKTPYFCFYLFLHIIRNRPFFFLFASVWRAETYRRREWTASITTVGKRSFGAESSSSVSTAFIFITYCLHSFKMGLRGPLLKKKFKQVLKLKRCKNRRCKNRRLKQETNSNVSSKFQQE